MLVVHDTRCSRCGHFEADVECRRGGREENWQVTMPSCLRCGGATAISWEAGVAPTVKLFASRVVGSGDDGRPLIVSSRAEEERLVAHIKARHPAVTEVHIEPDSKLAQKRRADEARHMGWSERQRLGVAEEAVAAQKEMIEAVKVEAETEALRKNLDPAPAGTAAMESVPSAAALSGAVP